MEMILAILGVLGTLAGTYIGFVLSERATKEREAKSEAKQKSAISFIVGREIDQNIQFLVEYLEKVNAIESTSNRGGDQGAIRSTNLRKITAQPCPPFSKIALESQLPILGLSLDVFEVTEILRFYSRIEKFQALQSAMGQMLNDQTASSDNVAATGGTSKGLWSIGGHVPREPFNENAPAIWEECAKITAQIIADGNPIQNVHFAYSRR